jgi:hypothetical protein
MLQITPKGANSASIGQDLTFREKFCYNGTILTWSASYGITSNRYQSKSPDLLPCQGIVPAGIS